MLCKKNDCTTFDVYCKIVLITFYIHCSITIPDYISPLCADIESGASRRSVGHGPRWAVEIGRALCRERV